MAAVGSADMELTADQVMELTGGRDCRLHYHDFDRLVNHDNLAQLQATENTTFPTTDYAAGYNDDYIFADSTLGAFSVTLPVARAGRIVTVTRQKGASDVTILPSGSDTINQAASVVISSSHAPVRLKALTGTGYEAV